jgi:hypothetical protein
MKHKFLTANILEIINDQGSDKTEILYQKNL